MNGNKSRPQAPENATNDAIGRIADMAIVDYSGLVRRRLRRIAFHASAGAFVVVAFLAIIAAGGILLAERYGAVAALLIIAGAALVIALSIYMAGILADRSARRTEALMTQNRRIAMLGALSLLTQKPRRSMTLLVVLGALFTLRKVLMRRG
jgi:MFS family permease